MIPKRVTLKNFLSFGEDEQTLDFTEDEALWVLTGPNGVGKSAVFDAITYCLFGQHRGGKDGASSLIRHGANAFRVALEFEFNAVDYRITRTRGANTTQRVEKRDGEGWSAIPGVNNVTELGAWVERTLGIGFEAFTSSVLLRQGEADAIVEATGKRRLEILKRIIEVERFEKLSNRIADAVKQSRSRLDDLRQRREGMVEATDELLDAARVLFEQAEVKRAEAHDAKMAASQRVEQAKQLDRLVRELSELDGKLRDADERAKQRDEIKRDHERFAALQAVVPPLRKIAAAKVRIAETETKQSKQTAALTAANEQLTTAIAALEKARADATAHTQAKTENENEAKRLGELIERESKFLSTAENVAKLALLLQRFAPDLDAKLQAARDAQHVAEEAVAAAASAKTEAETRLKQTKEHQKEFDTVGATCSRCRQPVDKKHADAERTKLTRDLADFTKQLQTAELALTTAKHEKLAAKTEADAMWDDVQARNKAVESHTLQKKTLDDFGVLSDSTELKKQLDAKESAKTQHEKKAASAATIAASASADAKRLEASSQKLTKDRDALDLEVRKLETTLAVSRAERDTLHASLDAEWQSRAAAIGERELDGLASEQATLEKSGITQRFAALQNDSKSQIEWNARRDVVKRDLSQLPPGSVAEAEALLTEATNVAKVADTARDLAKAEADRLAREAEAFQALIVEIAAAEVAHDRRRKLGEWLGKDGLLRELVRDAERDIVRFAQDTLRNLSGGDLEIELQSASDGRDEALVLLVRRANDPEPIPVKFLSGSQKFRVAVAIAIAIGKFASGTTSARPLESVIIDEGFGSLDKDGLKSMRDELENLKDSQALKRVILVSHQEEFTASFPIGYRLEPGENGAKATRFRGGSSSGL